MSVERINQIADQYVPKAITPSASQHGSLPQQPFPPLLIMVTFTLISSLYRSWEIVAILNLQDTENSLEIMPWHFKFSHPSQLFDPGKLNGLRVHRKSFISGSKSIFRCFIQEFKYSYVDR